MNSKFICFYFYNFVITGNHQRSIVMFGPFDKTFLGELYAFVNFLLHLGYFFLIHYRLFRHTVL